MASPDRLSNAAAVVASGYLKRWLEGVAYDRLATTAIMAEAHALPDSARYGIEAALNILNAVFDSKFVADTPVKRVVKEVALDAAPELSKRLINGSAQLRNKAVAIALLQLSDADLTSLLEWVSKVSLDERRSIRALIQQLDIGELARLARMASSDQARFLEISRTKPGSDSAHNLASRIRRLRQRLKKGGET